MPAFFSTAGRSARGILLALFVTSALFVYGHEAMGQEEPKSAGDDVDKLLEITRLSVKTGDMAKAVKSASEAARLAPENPEVQAEYVATLFAAKDFIAVEQAAKDATAAALKKDNRAALIRIMDVFSQSVAGDLSSYQLAQCPERIKELDPFNISENCRKVYPDEPWLTLASVRISNVIALHREYGKDHILFALQYGLPAIEKAFARRDWELTCLLAEECDLIYDHQYGPWPADWIEVLRNSSSSLIERAMTLSAGQCSIDAYVRDVTRPSCVPLMRTRYFSVDG